jgi:putative ABC transport system permease protein
MKMLILCFRNLSRNVRRTIAILLTIALGTGALFSFQGFIKGALDKYKENTIHSHHGNGQVNTKGYRETVHEKPWDYWITNWTEVCSFLSNNPAVQHVFPRVSIQGMLIHGDASITGQGQGIHAEEEAKFFDHLNIEEGQLLTVESDGILLGRGLARALDAHPGDKITLYTKATSGSLSKGTLTVVGIFHTGSAEFDNRVFRLQLEEAQKLLKTDDVESISIGLADHSYWSEIAPTVVKAFPDLETASFSELNKLYYQNSVDWLEMQFYIVQIIILSIVILGIFNTISTAILERKQEIGNLRANGDSVSDVMKLILCEGAILSLIGSLIGIGVTTLLSEGFLHQKILMPPGPGSTRQFFLSFSFTTMMAAKTIALSTISAIAASFLAGIKVARMPIAKALRN